MSTAVVSFPPIMLHDFAEHRVRRPIRGSLVDEYADILLTEPVAAQLSRFLHEEGCFAFNPHTSHVNSRTANGDRFISVCYVLASADKSAAARLMYAM